MEKVPVMSIILLLSFAYPAFSAPGSRVSGKNLTEICSRAVDPTFCVQSLESDPRTATSDLPGLANISVGLATSNATAALGLVMSLAGREPNTVLKGLYVQCSTWYEEAVKELEKARQSVRLGDFMGIGESASMALEKSEDCSDAFAVSLTEPAQVKESNRNVQHLCNVVYVIAVAIVG